MSKLRPETPSQVITVAALAGFHGFGAIRLGKPTTSSHIAAGHLLPDYPEAVSADGWKLLHRGHLGIRCGPTRRADESIFHRHDRTGHDRGLASGAYTVSENIASSVFGLTVNQTSLSPSTVYSFAWSAGHPAPDICSINLASS